MPKRLDIAAPKKRTGLVVQKIGNEAIVYDGETHQAHSLNKTAALVFQHVDGNAKISDIAGKVAGELGTSDEKLVRVALDQLGAAGLLNATPPVNTRRRGMIRGLTVALLPVVTTVLVPKAAAAASCVPQGSPCVSAASCCTGPTCNSVLGCGYF